MSDVKKRVTAIQGTPVNPTVPTTGQVLQYDGTQYTPTTQVITSLQGFPISSTTPTAGQFLLFNGTEWTPTTVSIPFINPTNIAGLQLWLRADLGITLSGSEVINWADQSGIGDNNRNATQSAGSTCPTFNSSDSNFNNQPTLSFSNASAQWMTTNAWTTYIAQPTTIVFVCSQNSAGGTAYKFTGGVTNGDAPQMYYNGGGDNTWSIYSDTVNLTGPSATANTPIVFYAEFNGGTSSIRISQETPFVIGATNPSNCGQYGFGIGGDSNGSSEYLDGTIAEVLVYNSILSTIDRTNLQNYLSARYAITIGS